MSDGEEAGGLGQHEQSTEATAHSTATFENPPTRNAAFDILSSYLCHWRCMDRASYRYILHTLRIHGFGIVAVYFDAHSACCLGKRTQVQKHSGSEADIKSCTTVGRRRDKNPKIVNMTQGLCSVSC